MSNTTFPIVGIGASAGGLAAFEAFFSSMPDDVDIGMAFVLVQHLAPDHKSILAEIIQRYTKMAVFEVTDGMVVAPNCAYIIPPNHDMAFLNGSLQLFEPSAPRGHRLPIDFFFRSLANDQHERAICLVLSGTGTDGTLGVRTVKGEGGMVMVQSPSSAEYDGMLRSAIDTGLVDYELAPAEMPAQLMSYVARVFDNPSVNLAISAPKTENAMKKIFILLRTKTGHDFSQYKSKTIHRRIERRMAVHQIENLSEYVKFLQQTATEVEALFRDLLIGVTRFFRDQDAFKVLEDQVIPDLFANKPAGAVIRIWSTGCSTGEEAYSLAILLAERQKVIKKSFKVQVFATDIDSKAIATARVGLYPASIIADVSPERLSQFFTVEQGGNGYRIHKGIRDMLVFSEQNVTKDPPFSKLDLISCRNLLIYMNSILQKKLIPMFHYSLKPGGVLFLGTSETLGEFDELFIALDRKMKLYKRKEEIHSTQRALKERYQLPMAALDIAIPSTIKNEFPMKLPLRELTEQMLLQQLSMVGILVNQDGDILYLHGRTGRYLEPTPGVVGTNNILLMAREGMRYELTTALHKVATSKEIVSYPSLRVKTNGEFSTVRLSVCPIVVDVTIEAEMQQLYLVILEELPSSVNSMTSVELADEDTRLTSLKLTLQVKDEYLQSANEELETSNEELKSSNEEMQSVNEELQSTNEELETTKEELQSLNEEMTTINAEMQSKLMDVTQLNNDMNNLLAGTGIGTIFVNHSQCILRFTPTVTKIINLIPGDVGRPVGHIVANLLNYDRLVDDVQLVLDTLIPKDLEVQTKDGYWYLMHIIPYRTLDNVIEGAVITFINITEQRQVMEALAISEIRFRRLFETVQEGVLILDAETGKIMAVNPFLIEILGYSQEQFIEKVIWEIGCFKDIAANRENFLELQQKEYIRYENLPLETASGRQIEVEFISSVYSVDQKKLIQCNIRDITERTHL